MDEQKTKNDKAAAERRLLWYRENIMHGVFFVLA